MLTRRVNCKHLKPRQVTESEKIHCCQRSAFIRAPTSSHCHFSSTLSNVNASCISQAESQTANTNSLTLANCTSKSFLSHNCGAISHEHRHSRSRCCRFSDFGILSLVRQGGNHSMSVRSTRPAFIKAAGAAFVCVGGKSYNLHSVQVHRHLTRTLTLSAIDGEPQSSWFTFQSALTR